MYCPLYLTTPGGMLEAEDARGSVEAACERELAEEVQLEIEREKHLVALVRDVKGVSGVNLIIEAIACHKVSPTEQVVGNEEWLNSRLKWVPVRDLGNLDTSRVLEGLLFAADQWHRHLASGESILWPHE
jgi:ADP-ribose pyrophosphatase YjhB (NUDIX family)